MSAQPAALNRTERVAASMLAWQVTAAGPPHEALELRETGVPAPGPGEVLVEVWSAGLGRSDLEALHGPAPTSPTPITPVTPGAELCGEVVAVGEGVDRVRLGERVIGLTRRPHGALAGYAVARAADVMPAPSGLDDAAAAVFHVAFQTGWTGLYRRAALRVGESLVVHGATGALGSAAVQLGRAAGARVIAVVGSAEQVPVARGLGAVVVIDRTACDVVEEVRRATDGAGADVVYDAAAEAALEQSTGLVAFEGRIVVAGGVARDGAGQEPPLAPGALRQGNYTLLGLDWQRYRQQRPEIVARAHADLTRLADAGALRPLLAAKLDFEDAPEGLARVAADDEAGRIAVTPP